MASKDEDVTALARLSLAESIPCLKPAAKPPASAFDRMMAIIIQGKEFQMHRGLLCFHSKYFKNLLDGHFREGGSNRHTLADVTVNTFTMFYNWVYTGSVIDDYGTADAYLCPTDFINLYVFADFHMVNQLKNRALELFFMEMARTWQVDISYTCLIYGRATSESKLRKLQVAILLDVCSFSNWLSCAGDLPKDFIIDLFEACRELEIAPGSSPGLRNRTVQSWIKKNAKHFCEKYHDHQELEPHPVTTTTPLSATSDSVACTCCGGHGHTFDVCGHRRARGGSITCYKCGQEGHIARNCPGSGD